MQTTMLTAGVVCVIGAIVGGGLSGFGITIPVLNSLRRQAMLGVFGIALIALSFGPVVPNGDQPGQTQVTFENRSAEPVNMYLVNNDGKEELYKVLQPGQHHSATTYISHEWRVRSEKTGMLIKTVAVESTTKNVVIVESDVRALLTQGVSLSPIGFVLYNGNKLDDQAMRRTWNRNDDGTWEEREPNGHVTTLRVVDRTSIEGTSGTHLLKISDTNQHVFIPDKGSNSTRLLWRQSSGDWTYIGDIRDVR